MKEVSISNLQQRVAMERDQQAYKLLFLNFYNGLARFACSILRNKEASEEVVSDVMLKVWTMEKRLVQINNLNIYLYKATKNTALNYLTRDAAYLKTTIPLEDSAEYALPDDRLFRDELRWEIEKAVKALPPKCQSVYRLIREEGLSYKEVAAVLSISENTVDRHLTKALHRLVHATRLYLNYS